MLGAGGEGDDRGWDGWMASPTRWSWVWVNSGRWDGQGGLAGCYSWGHQESDTTERLNWTELLVFPVAEGKFYEKLQGRFFRREAQRHWRMGRTSKRPEVMWAGDQSCLLSLQNKCFMKQYLLQAMHFDNFYLIILLFGLWSAGSEPLNWFHNSLTSCDLQLKNSELNHIWGPF